MMDIVASWEISHFTPILQGSDRFYLGGWDEAIPARLLKGTDIPHRFREESRGLEVFALIRTEGQFRPEALSGVTVTRPFASSLCPGKSRYIPCRMT